MQNAINEISDIMDMYPEIYKIEIIDKNDIALHYSTDDDDYNEERFTDAVQLLEWCEENLQQK